MGEVIKSYYEQKFEEWVEEERREGVPVNEEELEVVARFVDWLHKEGLKRAAKDPEGERD